MQLTLYHDLDVFTIGRMPAGKALVKTVILAERQRDVAYDAIREAVKAGQQAFISYPFIAPSEPRPALPTGGTATSPASVSRPWTGRYRPVWATTGNYWKSNAVVAERIHAADPSLILWNIRNCWRPGSGRKPA